MTLQRMHLHAMGVKLDAMGVKLPEIEEGHPNRTPFKGILTKVDEPSDKAPSGSHGHRILIPAALARQKLDTLIGMGVGITPDLEDHDSRFKIGHITQASVAGNDLIVEGILFAKDFEEEISAIKAAGDEMGMSFEIADVAVKNPDDDIWVLHDLTFTGAAILKRESAAYETTSLIAAKADQTEEEGIMTTTKKVRRAAAGALEDLHTVVASLQAMEDKAGESVDAAENADDQEAGDPNRAVKDQRKDRSSGNKFTKDGDNYSATDDEDDDEVGSDPHKQAAAAEAKLVAAALKALKAGAGVDKFEDIAQVVAAMKKLTAGGAKKQADQKAMGMDYGGGGDMRSMLQQMMSMCKAMMSGMGPGMMEEEEPGMNDPNMMEQEDGDQDMAMLKRLVKKMESYNASAEKKVEGNRLDTLEASVSLITDSVKKMTGLLTDSKDTGKKLATDDASRRTEDGKKVERRTLTAGGDYEAYLSKYGIDAKSDYTVAQIDSVLKEAGVTDPSTRIAVKHGLEAQGRLN